jgi:DNA polymerase I-like protein with 3'-5' exonuclease and polymerase domains
VDIHQNNKERFKLPERRIAKIFVFRLIYGGQAYSYAHDSDFNHISKSQDYWQKVVDEFYAKYSGIAAWHDGLVKSVVDTGRLVMPTGRTFLWDRADVVRRLWFHRPKILNYPVQGTGADLVAIGRVALWKRLRKAEIPHKFVSTVHDSIDIDVETCYNSSVCKMIDEAIRDIPVNFERLFGVKFDLPVGCEIGYGPNLANLTPYKKEEN